MKILFTGDLHLEAGRSLGNGAEYGAGSRFQDQVGVLDRIAELARVEDVGAVCVLGDVFDRPIPSPWAILAFHDFVIDLTCPTYVITGNHDVKNATLPHALRLTTAGDTKLADRPCALLPFATLPWTPLSRLVAAGHTDPKAAAAGMLLDIARRMRADGASILLGHWAVSGFGLPAGRSTDDLVSEPVIDAHELAEIGFDVCAFGHIHRPDEHGTYPGIFYVGSPMPLNFGEAGFDHGVWLYDTDTRALRFRAIPSRPLLTIDADTMPSPEGWRFDGAIIRYRYQATEQDRPDENEIREAFLAAGAAKVLVQGEVVRENRSRVEGVDEHVGHEEALRMWFQAQPEDTRIQAVEEALLERHADVVAEAEGRAEVPA